MKLKSDWAFSTLLYRYVFFDWLFVDFGRVRDPAARRAAWEHNRAMRRYLPLYLQRWSVISFSAFGLGCVFEQLLLVRLAACFFAGCALALTGMAVMGVLWLFLSRRESP